MRINGENPAEWFEMAQNREEWRILSRAVMGQQVAQAPPEWVSESPMAWKKVHISVFFRGVHSPLRLNSSGRPSSEVLHQTQIGLHDSILTTLRVFLNHLPLLVASSLQLSKVLDVLVEQHVHKFHRACCSTWICHPAMLMSGFVFS